MSRYNHKRKWSSRDYVIRYISIVFASILLVALMPRENMRTYHYEKGSPWDYSTLIAEDSFPVFKSEDLQANEHDSIMQYYEPYFQCSAEVCDSMLNLWHQTFDRELKGHISPKLEKYISNCLLAIYDHGIVTSEDLQLIDDNNICYVRIIEGNMSSVQSSSDLFSPKTAYEYILREAGQAGISHDELIQCSLNQFLICNLVPDRTKNDQQIEELESSLTPYLERVVVGQKIVDRGQIIDEHTFCVLQSMTKHQSERSRSTTEILLTLAGQLVFCIIIMILLLSYFQQFRSDYLEQARTMQLIAMLFMLFPILTYALSYTTAITAYALPFCMSPIFIRIFMDSRTAFVVHFLSILTCSIAVNQPEEFIIVESTAGLTAILSLRELTQRSELFRTVLLTLAVSLITYGCTEVYSGHIMVTSETRISDIISILLSSLLLMVSYLLLIPIEKGFGFTSSVTLIELSNTNNPLLRSMSEEAPGTFQHSMQVSNLCVAVAEKIGAKTQLVRTGAMYHDIGKIRHAAFYTENQNGLNPHDRLTYEQSAQIIISHVREGLALADKNKLPKIVKDFIATHHGTSMAKYFYIQAQNKSPEQKIDTSIFTYPGPNPQTREQAILTMCDAVEAASRSLKEITEENITKLIDAIIDGQLSAGLFKQSPITFQEIETAKEVLKNKLKIIYHTRVQYPELKSQSTS